MKTNPKLISRPAPPVIDPGGSTWARTGVKVSQTRQRLEAGDDRRGGGARLCISGDQIDDGEQLRDAGSEPRCLVEKVELGEAGNNASDDLGGRRSSGEDEPEATGHGEARGVVR